ncbi:uncharacterized protein LOC127250894 [Andrographis paniculata]|uniref:uncharacterized protein LOC127250894 n=1 Tax=Andrographis paniculata TaxID=175694 RepID=UPI0021E955D9|nr:uncharacterized protein LOC127250894 [Andrographis paniculata]
MWDPSHRDDALHLFEQAMDDLRHMSSYIDVESEEEEEEEEEEEDEEDEEEEEEEEEEQGEEDNGNSNDADQGARRTLREVLYGNRSSNTIAGTSREALDLDTQASSNDLVVVGESNGGEVGCNQFNNGGNVNDHGVNGEELNRGEIDGLICPICFEPWSSGSGSDHNVCCLPCGHIYGFSCIKKWLRRPRSSKCPQCKKDCGVKDIRLLYATQVVAVDGELQKRVQSLEAKCATLEKKNANWSKMESEWKKREADILKEVQCLKKMEVEWRQREADMQEKMQHLKERTHGLEGLLGDTDHRVPATAPTYLNGQIQRWPTSDLDVCGRFQMEGCMSRFKLEMECHVVGARLFDIDCSSHLFITARRLPGRAGLHVLTKVSMFNSHEKDDIRLPENIKVVKDLKISPHSKHVLLASLGKKLLIFSTESNNPILTYQLPAAAWSCSWDASNAQYAYAGLQNGMVLQFDRRYTKTHVECLTGLRDSPVHTLHSLLSDSSLSSGTGCVLSASSIGLCQWNFGGREGRPFLIPESDKQGVCISVAYCPSTNDIVASYRPKIEPSAVEITQPTLAPCGQVTVGSHVLYKRLGCSRYHKLGTTFANVSDIRFPKSAIIDGVYPKPVFVSGDEATNELTLQELPSLNAVEWFKPLKPPIRDVKFARLPGSGLLSCLSEDSLYLLSAKLM